MASVVVDDAATLTPALRGADIVLRSPGFAVARTTAQTDSAARTGSRCHGHHRIRPRRSPVAAALTLQALSGGLAQRGLVKRPPLMAGGRLGPMVGRSVRGGAQSRCMSWRRRGTARCLRTRVARIGDHDAPCFLTHHCRLPVPADPVVQTAQRASHQGRLRGIHGRHRPAMARFLRTRRAQRMGR
jgi:hypothetical protein